jgi:uncharacterized protein
MVRFEWDLGKNRNNKKKHGIDFETAQLIFDDPHFVSFVDRVDRGEERWHAIGSIGRVLVIVVVHTYCEHAGDEIIRMISGRRATTHERNLYGEAIG